MAKVLPKEIEQLKEQLKQKVEEYRNIYAKLVESGGVELPEEVLDQIAGGLIIQMTAGAWSGSTTEGGGR